VVGLPDLVGCCSVAAVDELEALAVAVGLAVLTDSIAGSACDRPFV
jgi:hypothetical protein